LAVARALEFTPYLLMVIGPHWDRACILLGRLISQSPEYPDRCNVFDVMPHELMWIITNEGGNDSCAWL